ncbi:MAG: hypothetical protein SGJ27_11560 [Candidatus Melainabacteria bacterium]|nr:hypothetical protein [Candidatus Melainabacteria bacterium]
MGRKSEYSQEFQLNAVKSVVAVLVNVVAPLEGARKEKPVAFQRRSRKSSSSIETYRSEPQFPSVTDQGSQTEHSSVLLDVIIKPSSSGQKE